MVFVCPTKEAAEAITKMSSQVQHALQHLDDKLKVPVKPCCIPCCVPMCDYPESESHHKELEPPKIMVCYKEHVSKKHKSNHKIKKQSSPSIRLKESKSRELRASILYTGCQCEKHDGLQDDCPRTGCHGSPECMTSPPTCGPSEFCDGKHLGKKIKGKNGKGHGGKNNEHEEDHHRDRYKCFAATLDTPIMIPCPPCPCPPCL
ncbi:unnamed protein product [Ceutorhynchus assimilis]|uniref:Uncharacterized protein n=1 Tax=Ceutorhynchus assimilis TaxID=467358 RepID=A0A9N9MP05_9CUCU|nr:unnamed protein product [Ceutorhynchus assimilis]